MHTHTPTYLPAISPISDYTSNILRIPAQACLISHRLYTSPAFGIGASVRIFFLSLKLFLFFVFTISIIEFRLVFLLYLTFALFCFASLYSVWRLGGLEGLRLVCLFGLVLVLVLVWLAAH